MIHLSSLTMSKWMAKMVILNTQYRSILICLQIAESPLEIVTTHATGKSDGQGTYGVVWNVECTYTEAVAIVEEPVEVQVVVAATPVAAINSTPLDEMDEVLSFIAELDRWHIDDSFPFK